MRISHGVGGRAPTPCRRRPRAVAGLVFLVLFAVAVAVAQALPASAVDETKVPHYFGPWPNWANSPLAKADATVTIAGDGTGAKAEATVGAKGAITGFTITDPGSGYHNATVTIAGAGTGATADAVVQTSGAVSGVRLTAGGAGYVRPTVTFSGGSPTADATGHAVGGVDKVVLAEAGSGYEFPTVSFDLPDDPDGVQASGHVVCAETDCTPATPGGTVTIKGVVVDEPGSGYTTAPGVAILDGTQFDPINHDPGTFTAAKVSATLTLTDVVVDGAGAGYAAAPDVTIADADAAGGDGALATASTDTGTIKALTVTDGGSGYISGGIRKFVDTLPGLGASAANDLGQYLPVAEPDTSSFANADYYVIAVVQHREQMHKDLPATLTREYVQLSTSAVPGKHVPLYNDPLNATADPEPIYLPNGDRAYGVDDPHYLGPVIQADKNRPVRIVFYNLLPTGAKGDLFLPTDSSMMGSGMGPMAMSQQADQGTVMDGVRNPQCSEAPKSAMCFKDNRATLHLHGGVTPWISDGTPHQWITPATENTSWPKGVSVKDVPDMVGADRPAGVPDCSAKASGCQTFYYTNQQSARMMFYHDHSWGITRLNVYAGEAAGYLISDPTEKKLIADGTIPSDQIPLIIQDKTFVPDKAQRDLQDPTWDTSRWGTKGSFWYHHVYMPAQNPSDPSGMSAFGRWMYGPWFWPPADPQHGPIKNPYYKASCKLDDPSTWQYQTDPYCEPELIPGTPNVSAGMEQFNDTPVVNGTAYPETTVQPKSYRLRILNAANDRFWNLQWYVADPTTGTESEVALKQSELDAAQTDPTVFPTPDTSKSPAGPDWIQIGNEGGFLPAPTVVKNQPITWITDPTRFDFGNVDQHALALAPAERADAIVDFSKYAGKTLILYNDAPAAYPARVPCYDYYTGGPDLQPACAPTTLPGYGPNTRTIMRVRVAADGAAPAFDLAKLQSAFRHHADGSGVFEAGQHPTIVGQAAYNSAYGTSFTASGSCPSPSSTNKCDGFARINQQGGDAFTFDTLKGPKLSLPIQPKAIHDEMNATNFDEFGRMTANLGVEAVPAKPGTQNVTLYPYVNPATELIDASGAPVADVKVAPISTTTDGAQIWKVTHNGVDTHPIHFHLYDVQVLNRVTWDNIIIPPDANELGWKDTVRMSPLQDTIVALRPIIPKLPWEIPNSIRALNPMMPLGDTTMFNNVDPNGNPTTAITNKLVNFGWEYVFHCHILSHEEMDMMRPVSVVLPPKAPDGLSTQVVSIARNGRSGTVRLTWKDNSIAETAYAVQRANGSGSWVTLATIQTPLGQPNTTGSRSYDDTTWTPSGAWQYRVVARNTVGYGAGFPTRTAESASQAVAAIAAPSGLAATIQSATSVRLTWTDNAGNETGFVVQRSSDGGATWTTVATPAANATAFTDAVVKGSTYAYRVAAANAAGRSDWSNTVTVTVAAPAAPTIATGTATRSGSGETVRITWGAVAGATGYTVQWSATQAFTSVAGSQTVGITTTATTPRINRQTWYFRVIATNAVGASAPSAVRPVASA